MFGMTKATEWILKSFKCFAWGFLIVLFLFWGLFSVRYKNMVMTRSRIMSYNDTIAAYIQKNGGLVLPSGKSEQEFFKEIAESNQVDMNICADGNCMTEITLDKDSKSKDYSRSKIYTITTRYYLLRPNIPFGSGFQKSMVLKNPEDLRPIVSRAYITEYKNYK